MVKGNPKSSASSATRKKHAAKKTAIPDEPPLPPNATQKRPKTKAERKLSKKEPRVKMYIPPVKPAPVQPDPLETTGLARTLPADLLVVLKNISKKAQVTKIRALEELQTGWVEKCMKEKEGALADKLVEMLPVWLHHVSALFLHPSRRVRFLAVSLHASFLRISAVRNEILFFFRETASPSQTESILGAWSLAAYDIDRAVSTTALKAWKETFLESPSDGSSSSSEQLVLDDSYLSSIAAFVQRTALDPSGIFEYLNPLPPTATGGTLPSGKKGQPGGKSSAMATFRKDDSGTHTPRSKLDEQEESEQDRKARLRISALGAIRWIFGTTSNLSEDLLAFSSNPALWTALHPNETCPWIDGLESFGFAQPNVRKAAWGLVQTLLIKGQLETIVPVLGIAILRSAWVELDSTVQVIMWQPLLMFLKQFPGSWILDDSRKDDEVDGGSGSEAESDDEPQNAVKTITPSSLPQKRPSQAYLEFLQFLQLGCSGSPLQGYPAVIVILSTIPSSVMASSPVTNAMSSPVSEFFTSFWAAVDGRALSALHRSATSAAFLSSLLECMVFLIKRMRSNLPISPRPDPDQASLTATTSDLGESSLSILEATGRLVKDQFNHVWNELGTRKLKVEERAAARLLGKTMEDLGGIDHALMDVAWEAFVDGVRRGGGGGVDEVIRQHEPGSEQQQQQQYVTTASKTLISAMLKVFHDRFKDGTVLKKRVVKLVKQVLDGQLERFRVVERLEGEKLGLLVSMLDQFREGLFFDEGFSSQLDDLLARHAFLVLDLSPSLLLSYLLYRKSEERCLAVWHSLLSSIVSAVSISQEERTTEQKPIVRLLDAAQQGQLPSYLKPKGGELDVLLGALLEKALTGRVSSDEVGFIRQILTTSDYFISKSGYSTFLEIIIATFGSHVKQVVEGKEVRPALFEVAIDFVGTIFGKLSSSSEGEEGGTLLKSLLSDIFLFGYLLPLCDHTTDSEDLEGSSSASHSRAAKSLWEGWIKRAEEGPKGEVVGMIKMRLKMFVEDTHIHPLPEDVFLMLSRNPPGIRVDLLHDIFPSATQLDLMLDDLSPDAIDPSIAVLDPLIPPFTLQPHLKTTKGKQETDRRGFTAYARIVNALLQVFIEDRRLAKRALWALRHFLALSVYSQDLCNAPFPTFPSSALSSPSKHDANNYSPVFDYNVVTMSALRDVVSRVKQVSVYLLGSAVGQNDDGSWRKVVLEKLLKDSSSGKIESPKQGMSQVQQFLWDVIVCAKDQDKLRDTRVLKIVLESVFSDGVDMEEADFWIQLARKLEKTGPQTSITIIASITATGAEPPKLDRYRNEIAASLLGIKPYKANTEGLLALRKLTASAPDPDGDVVFLTSPRAINVVKACQGWVLAVDSDNDDGEEMEERVESAMLPIFMHLAPILQNIPGGHWAFVFDVLEGVLERASSINKTLEEEAGEMGEDLVALTRAVRLVLVLEELANRNKSLMAEWEERRMGILVVIRDLSMLGLDSGDVFSVPLSTCRELVLSFVQHIPSSLIDQDTLSKMCHLIQDPSPSVQKKAYQLLRAAAKKRTEYFVIEAAVDTEGVIQAELPIELMAIVQSMQFGFGFGLDEGIGGESREGEETAKEEDQSHHVFGYLLAWMLLFDLFQDVSFKVKSSYIEQLKNHDVVVGHFIPCFLSLLRLDQGSLVKVFKLDVWGVDEFYIDLCEPGSPHTIPVLAAHLYYRALLTIPSLIHSWVLDCKDRQLTNTVTTYTSTYFSPVITRAELEHVRTHCTSIVDENMSVKVAQAINEVVAAYSVDEHQLEVKLKIPTDWPLHRVEIKDVKVVGVEEKMWRAWMLGVQQTMYAHNGRIVDALNLFKKNVTLHFEGQVECAICYSIISVMDGSLPKKPCRTCKNRFHAGCLYKWFSSSHSSSCPLCRSDIM